MATLPVQGLADDPPGNPPHVRKTACEQPEVWPAESERSPERLTLAHCHVRPELAWRAQKADRDGVEAHDESGADPIGDRPGGCDVLEAAEVVRGRHDDGTARPLVDDLVPGGDTPGEGHDLDLVARAPREGLRVGDASAG